MHPEEPRSPLPIGRFEGRDAFRQLVRDALACAAREGWPELVFCDADFADWPLGESEVVQQLHQWAGHRRRLTVMAADFEVLARLHPRFVQWRVRWDHLVVARRLRTAHRDDAPSALWSAGWMAHRLDPLRSVGVGACEPERLARLREQLSEWERSRSVPGFAASVLGL